MRLRAKQLDLEQFSQTFLEILYVYVFLYYNLRIFENDFC